MKLSLKKISIKTWQLVVIFIPLLFLTMTFLRLDHIRMTEYRDAVLVADDIGDVEILDSALFELKSFVSKNIVINIVDKNGTSNISFGTGPFYLKKTYYRAASKAISEAEKKLESGDNPYGNIYALANDTCKPLAIAGGWAWDSEEYISCMTSEIEKYPSSSEIVDTLKADIPSTELYRREFSSPVWVPSISGIMILICLIMLVVIFTRLIIWIIIRLSLLFI